MFNRKPRLMGIFETSAVIPPRMEIKDGKRSIAPPEIHWHTVKYYDDGTCYELSKTAEGKRVWRRINAEVVE